MKQLIIKTTMVAFFAIVTFIKAQFVVTDPANPGIWNFKLSQ